MSDHEPDDSGANDADYLIEEDADDLEAAFQEALEAVEKRDGGNGAAAAEDRARPPSDAADAAAEVREELARTQERLARALADFDNFRKRTERERSDLRRYDGFSVLKRLVEIVDNLERALAADGSADDLRQGLEMIVRQVHDLLRRSGVHRVETVGQAFDPQVHDAILRHEDPEVSEPTVDQELQAGYEMHERLLRPARVRVAMPAEEEAGD